MLAAPDHVGIGLVRGTLREERVKNGPSEG